MRYYFNVRDGKAMLDEEGMECDGMVEVKQEALQSSVELLRSPRGEHFWAGEPWLLWVTDQPNGGGNTFLTLTFSSRLSG